MMVTSCDLCGSYVRRRMRLAPIENPKEFMMVCKECYEQCQDSIRLGVKAHKTCIHNPLKYSELARLQYEREKKKLFERNIKYYKKTGDPNIGKQIFPKVPVTQI